jgi:hypothetical protein
VSDEVVFAEPVRGHRYWFLDTKKMHLFGMNGYAWDTGFMEARCTNGHESPHWSSLEETSASIGGLLYWPLGAGECMCGVNAYKLTTPVETATMDQGKIHVHGLVDLGGRVHEYERGYRAQYGLMVEGMILTHIPFGSNFTGYLEAKYECPFKVMTPADWKVEWEATYGRDRETVEEDQNTQATPRAFTFPPIPTSSASTFPTGKSAQSIALAQSVAAYQNAMLKAMYASPVFGHQGGSFDDVEALLKRRSVGDWILDNAFRIWLIFSAIVFILVAVLTGVEA